MGPTTCPTLERTTSVTEASSVTFPDAIEPRSEVELLRRSLSDPSFNAPEQTTFEQELRSFRKYLFRRESSWVLDSSIVQLTSSVLNHSPSSDRVRLFRLFAHCSLRNDFTSLFSSDRRDMCIMNYVNKFASLSVEEQKAVALFLCHASSQEGGRNYLLYLSRWTAEDGRELCNAEVSSRAAGCALKSYNPALRDYGLGVVFNLSLKENFASIVRGEEEVLQAYIELAKCLVQALVDFSSANEGSMTPKASDLCQKAIRNLSKALD